MAVHSERRGVWGRWLVQQRKEHGNQTQEAVRQTLASMGHPISEAYYGDFERGKAVPNADWQAVFKRLWGSLPDEGAAQGALDQDADIKALLREQTALLAKVWPALERQTAAITELTEELRASRGEQIGFDRAVVGILARLEDALVPASRENADESRPRKRAPRASVQ